MKLTLRLILHITTAVLMGMAITLPVIAQDRAEEPDVMQKDRDFDARSSRLRIISERRTKVAPRPKSAELLSQARSDFRTMQMINKDLKRVASETTALDLKFVSNSAAEIRQHAESLNTILPLPKRDKKAERLKPIAAAAPDELRRSMLTLSQLIQSFISNPCFKESSLADNEQTRTARLALENIIELSKQLQKQSEKFQKPSRKDNP